MAVKEMELSKISNPTRSAGALYFEEIEVLDGITSDIFIIPIQRVYSICVNLAGTGSIEFSNDSYEKLEAGTADFKTWNGTDIINLGVIAFRVVSLTGTFTAKVAVKTATT